MILSLLLSGSICAGGGFTLKGTIDGFENKKIYLITRTNKNERLKDSCTIKNGRFYFKGHLKGFSDLFYLKMDPNQLANYDSLNAVQVALDDTVMEIKLRVGHFSEYVINGCSSCGLFKSYLQRQEKYYNDTDSAENEIGLSGDSLLIQNSRKRISSIYLDYINNEFEFCEKNPANNFTPYTLYWISKKINENYYARYIAAYAKLSARQKDSFYGKMIRDYADEYSNILRFAGKPAPSFTAKTIGNDSIVLYKIAAGNKLTLLSFWASWCVPCRKETPGLRALYQKYNSKGLGIIAISDDSDSNAWRTAVAKDGMTDWINVLLSNTSIKRTGNGFHAQDEYLIRGLPLFIVVDSECKVVARFDNDCIQKLTDLLNKYYEK